jgi:hypothetical protein
MVEDPQFLWVCSFGSIPPDRAESFWSAWIDAAGPRLTLIWPVIVHNYLSGDLPAGKHFTDKQNASVIAAGILRRDAELTKMAATWVPPERNVVDSFLREMKALAPSPLTRYVLSIIRIEENRQVRRADGHYSAVSNLLFFRTIGKDLHEKLGKEHNKRMDALGFLFRDSPKVPQQARDVLHFILDDISTFEGGSVCPAATMNPAETVQKLVEGAFRAREACLAIMQANPPFDRASERYWAASVAG